MPQSFKPFFHYSTLVAILILGTGLRFWNLDLKPLWLDEVITALFSLGHSYSNVPLDVIFPVANLAQIFKFNSGISCPEIANTLIKDSTHPPLFFCLMYSWLNWMRHSHNISLDSLAWVLRSLPALMGVGAIAAIYCLNRIAFSPAAGLMAAALMAVSPFGIYLSQEARHYSLPVLLITLALLGLILIQQDLCKGKQPPLMVGLFWVLINTIGFYVHYFFILTFIAQLIALIAIVYKNRNYSYQEQISFYLLPFVYSILPVFFYLPWAWVIIGHFGRSETNWIPQPQNIAPIYQTLVGWLLMAIALPTENQPIGIAIVSGLLMLCFGFWLGWRVFQRLKSINNTSAKDSIFTLEIFTLCVLFELLLIVYFTGKDLTIAPRYHFVSYPAIVAILGATIIDPKEEKSNRRNSSSLIVLLVGFISSILVASNLVFIKPYNPEEVIKNMNIEPNVPVIVVVGYFSSQDVALGLSFALEANKIRGNNQIDISWAFLDFSVGYDNVWKNLSQMPTPIKSPLNLWVVAPGFKQANYPKNLTIYDQTICNIDPSNYKRLGVPYQLYRCPK